MRNIIALLLTVIFYACTSSAKETRFKVLIADTGIDLNDPFFSDYYCDSGHVDLTSKGIQDKSGHGTNVAGLILKDIDPNKVCIIIAKWFHKDDNLIQINKQVYNLLMRWSEYDYDMLNFSANGPSYMRQEVRVLNKALEKGIYVVVAAGNDKKNLSEDCTSFPACYATLWHFNRFRVVTDNRLNLANKGGPAKNIENGMNQCYKLNCLSGSSQATAKHTNRLLKSLGFGYNRR